MTPPQDWLSRLLDLVPVHGRLDLRCYYGAPWRIDQGPAAHGEIPYHVVLSGSAMLEDPAGRSPMRLSAGDILVLPQGPVHVLHDGSGAPAVPAQARPKRNLTISENGGDGSRLDMLCGHFVLATPHDRLLRNYLPPRLVVHTATTDGMPDENGNAQDDAAAQLSSLVALMRRESATDHLGGRAMLNALSTALFALTLRLASEAAEAPLGLLALAGHPRLAPALDALFNQPGRAWTLPDLAPLCHMSRRTPAQRCADGCPDDHCRERIAKTLSLDRRGGGSGRLSIRGGLSACVQAAYGRHAGRLAPCGATRCGNYGRQRIVISPVQNSPVQIGRDGHATVIAIRPS